MNASVPTPVDRTAQIAAVAAICAAAASFLGLPVVIGLLADMRGLAPEQLGQIASAENFGLAVTALFSPWLLRRCDARLLILAGLVALAAMHFLSTQPMGFATFFGVRLAASVAAGVVMPAAVAVLGRSTEPERAFAWAVSAQVVLSSAELLAFGPLAKAVGLWGVYGAMGALACVTMVLMLGARLPQGVGHAPAGSARLSFSSGALIASVWFFFCAIGAYWVFIERAGVQVGLSPEELGGWLALSNLVALAGSASAPWWVKRFGDRWVLVLGMLLTVLVPLGLLLPGSGRVGYLFNLAMFVLLWNLLMVVQMAVLGRWDPHGRAVALTPAAQGFGLALAPLLTGMLAEQQGFAVAVASASVFAVLALVVTWIAFSGGVQARPDRRVVMDR
ncbi:MFS transporter [Acidovorax sp.]|uniref:MFS transporter n=1 Tax=Acidovorax sp. TaxID=1872122 RepID=UPI00262B400B|nr:MFS transporter [Acidovorax sp.]